MKFLQKNNNGFTLAEVLITLVIVCVIASMTIPTLMKNTNKQEYVSRLKKTYSSLSQATNKIIAEQGNPKADIGGWATSGEAVFNMYKKYLSNAKVCSAGTTCSNKSYLQFNGNSHKWFDNTRNVLILPDGTLFSISNDNASTSCSTSSAGSTNICLAMFVDINGEKGPNFVGRDAFAFVLKENGLFPMGCDTNVGCAGTAGWGCACKVIRENAMNY